MNDYNGWYLGGFFLSFFNPTTRVVRSYIRFLR